MLILDSVRKNYGSFEALRDFSVSLEATGYAVIVGESGSGKSTLLRCIAGLLSVDSGTIVLNHTDITYLPAHARPIASVFQQFALFPHLTVTGNIAFGLEQQGLPDQEIRRRVADMLDMVSLTGLELRKPASLSGGQQQRVALARALAVRPQAVMLDEPLGSLDPELRATMRRELHRIQRESGVLFLHVSHDRDEALTLADYLLVLHAGRLIGADTVAALNVNPGNQRVAKMLGYENSLPHPGDANRQLMFAPEHVVLGEGDRSGRITSTQQVGTWIRREIALDSGHVVLQKGVSDGLEPIWNAGDVVSIAIPDELIKSVRRT